jgi:predicted nucleotidyltransferase
MAPGPREALSARSAPTAPILDLVSSPSLADQAQEIADFLAEDGPAIEAVLLYGSVARGSSNEWSDIDLLVVGARTDISASRLLRQVKRRFSGVRISIVYLAADQVREYLSSGSRFLVHIRQEGRILRDTSGLLADALSIPFEPISASEEVEVELDRLAMYDDLSRYGNNFLFCLAHIYTLAKTITMARLADVGVYEFDRERAFSAFAARWPQTEADVQVIRELRPFYSLVSRREPEPLPFSFRGSGEKVAAAVEAVRRIAATSTHELV